MQHQSPVHPRRQVEIVGGDQRRQALAAGGGDQGVEHPAGRLGIQIAGRFVGQKDTRPVGQRAGNGDALALSTGHLVRPLARMIGEAQRGEQIHGALAHGALAQPAERAHRHRHIIERRKFRQQMMKLENKANKELLNNKFISNQYRKAYYNKKSIFKPTVQKLNDLLYYNTMRQGLEELLRYADRNSMANGIEVRLPFLSHELVQFIFSLPSHYKIQNGFTKYILREAMKDQLPSSIVYRTDKVGYEPPQQQWMQSAAFTELLQESRRKLVDEKILKPAVLQKPVNAQSAHAVNNDDWRYFCAAHLL